MEIQKNQMLQWMQDLKLDNMAQFVNGSDEFTVSGVTDRVSQDITITVAPNGNVVTVAQISPSLDGEFEKIITVGGPLWKENGFYTVNAKQFDDPKYTDSRSRYLGWHCSSRIWYNRSHDSSSCNHINNCNLCKIKT